ncbi:MAG: tyrosine-type recombinase/integrase [Acidobacteria bacterium]|nr:tyrosine-type recombinase/integrase [Acidobacteriota bacterium]
MAKRRGAPAAARGEDPPYPFVALDGADPAAAEGWTAHTRSTYATQWNRFRAWCEERHVVPLDASPEEVAAYLHERAKRAKRATVKLSASAVLASLRAAGRLGEPTMEHVVAETLGAINEQKRATPNWEPRHPTALDHTTALAMMRAARRPQRRGRGWETESAAAARGRRDAAIVALAFGGGLRRSEIAALVWADITPEPHRKLRVRVRASQANARIDGGDSRRLVGEFAQAAAALREATAPAQTDRVVPLCAHQVNHRVQVLADALGLEGVSTHSGRRGLAFERLRRGASTEAVQSAGGWRSASMVHRYARGRS